MLLNTADAIHMNGAQADKVYLGSALVWPGAVVPPTQQTEIIGSKHGGSAANATFFTITLPTGWEGAGKILLVLSRNAAFSTQNLTTTNGVVLTEIATSDDRAKLILVTNPAASFVLTSDVSTSWGWGVVLLTDCEFDVVVSGFANTQTTAITFLTPTGGPTADLALGIATTNASAVWTNPVGGTEVILHNTAPGVYVMADAIEGGVVTPMSVNRGNSGITRRQSWFTLVVRPAPPGRYDPDTQAFLDASGLGEGYATALDELVKGLKQYGLWQKMTAVYPFTGGTADLHKWNLMDPRDTDDAYRLTYTPGSGSHSDDLGYQPNAVYDSGGGYADTHLVPAGTLDPASCHLSLFSLSPLSTGNRCDFGAYNWDGTTNRFHLIVHYMSGEFYYTLGHTGMNNTPAGDGSGLFTSSRTSITGETAYLNGLEIASNTTAGGVLPPVPLYIGCLNGFIDEFSNLPFGFVSIGSGLTSQEVADLNTVVREYVENRGNKPTSPIQLPGLGLWLEADQIGGVIDGGGVATWPDMSGSDFHANTVAAPPIWKQVGIGGQPSVEFAPTPTKMSVGGWGTALSGKSEYTLFQVIKQDEYGTWPVIAATPQDGLWQWITEYDPYPGVYWGHGNGCYRMYRCPLVPGQPHLLTYSLGSGGPKFYLNGVEQTSFGFGPSGDMQPGVPALPPNVDLGGYFNNTLGLTGQIAAMVWYDKFLVDSDRQSVELHLMTKYGLGG